MPAFISANHGPWCAGLVFSTAVMISTKTWYELVETAALGRTVLWCLCIISRDVFLQVRETSRKPDEMYSLLERLSPGTRKLEIFARAHNLQPGWVGLGNQLNGTKIMEPEMLERYEAKYGPVKNLPK